MALPDADGYRDVIVSSIEKASGMSVEIRSLQGHWGGLRPVVALEGLTLADRAGRAAFQLERAEVTLSWWWLLAGQVRFHDVVFYRPDLVLRRGADGLIYLADKPLNRAGPGDEAAFTQWLLAQPRLAVHRARLTWRDDFLGAPEIRLDDVEIQVTRRLGRHRAALTAGPPAELARRIDLRADVALRREAEQWRATGNAFFEALHADIGRLRTHLPVPETLRSAVGSLRVWLQFDPGGVGEVVADLNVRDARVELAADALPLQLASLSGRATYRTLADGFAFSTEGLRFRLASGEEAQPGKFTLARTAAAGTVPRLELRADGIDVKIAASLIDYFPLPRELKALVARFAPRGRIVHAAVSWTDDGAKAYAVRGRFEEIAINRVEAMPGLAGLGGEIEGTHEGGTVRLDARNARVDTALLAAPVALDRLQARASWKHAGPRLEVAVEQATLANADAEATFSGSWHSLPDSKTGSPGYVDLKGSFARAKIARAAQYLPARLAPTREWLQRAVQAGESPRLGFELKGDLWEFPFGGSVPGTFLIEGEVRGARLRYHPDWPAIDAIDGTVRFHNRSMEIRAQRAAIFASRVRDASAVIPDLSADPPLLTIAGEVDTTGADTVRFLRDSPLVNGPGAFTRAVAVEGPARLKLSIHYPLWGPEPLRVAGDYTFAGATASVGRTLTMRELQGRLAFTEKGVRAPELTGTLFGKPATLAISTQADGTVLTTIEGQVDSGALAAYLPESVATRLRGSTAWKARVLTGGEGPRLAVTSDLKGMAVALPAPLAKPAEEARAIEIGIERLGQQAEVSSVQLAGGVHGRFSRAMREGKARWQAALRFGAPLAGEPAREGLWLYGSLASLDVDAWLDVFAPAAGRAQGSPDEREVDLELRGADLELGRVRYLGREFQQMRARLERAGPVWTGRLESPLIAGDIRWNGEGRGSLVARLERFAIPEASPGARPAAGEQPDLPALDIEAARFDFRGRLLGSLKLVAAPAGEEWRIDRLDITAPHSKFTSSGVWRRTAAGPLTTLAVKLEAANLDQLFDVFGYGEHLKRGTGQMQGTLVWPGYPQEFALGNLSGSLKVEARSGQFARIEPGAGKLLGLLSLQSLPRRALFDFRDVFSDGFAFEKIEGDVKVARGVLLTDDFSISGSSAYVSLAGEVSMPQETQSLTMKVVPEVGEGMALAATVFGTPILGLSTLLMSKLLRNPLGKAVSYEYQVTGSWDNPVVTRTSAPAPRTAVSAAPEAAGGRGREAPVRRGRDAPVPNEAGTPGSAP